MTERNANGKGCPLSFKSEDTPSMLRGLCGRLGWLGVPSRMLKARAELKLYR